MSRWARINHEIHKKGKKSVVIWTKHDAWTRTLDNSRNSIGVFLPICLEVTYVKTHATKRAGPWKQMSVFLRTTGEERRGNISDGVESLGTYRQLEILDNILISVVRFSTNTTEVKFEEKVKKFIESDQRWYRIRI